MKPEIAEFDNTADILYNLYQELPRLKSKGEKEKYNKCLNEICLSQGIKSIKFYDNLILRCIDELHSVEKHQIGNYERVDKSWTHNTGDKKQKFCTTCTLIREVPYLESISYSPEEKLMLYILIYNNLSRIDGKKLKLADNFTYISLKDIHKMFGNKELKTKQKESYIKIMNKLINDKVEIYIGDGTNTPSGLEHYIGWFKKIEEVKDYDNNIIGYVYTFGDLGIRFTTATIQLNSAISGAELPINNRNYKEFEILRYLVVKIALKSKKIEIRTMMKELFDYQNGCTYFEKYNSLENPDDSKYYASFMKSLERIIVFLKDYYTLSIYIGAEKVDTFNDSSKVSLAPYTTKENINLINIRI